MQHAPDNMLILASAISGIASTMIPIRPLAGALTGTNFFVFVHKCLSTGYPGEWAPRTWTQLATGFIPTTVLMTIALSVPTLSYGIPTFLTAVWLGPYITYSDKLWSLCPRFAAPQAPHYTPIPSAPPASLPQTVSAAAG